MQALDRWLVSQTTLKTAVSDFLSACTTLKNATLQPVLSRYNQVALDAALDQIQSRISSLDLAENQLRESRTTLNVLLNSSTSRVPIHKLPPEILGSIFAIAVDSTTCFIETSKERRVLTEIQLVCLRWRHIAIKTPSLWSHVDVRFRPSSSAYNRLQLDRSSGIPIYLHIEEVHKIHHDAVSELMSILQSCAMLVQSVSVFGMDTSHLVQALFDMYPMHGTPTTLKSLTLAGIQVHSKEHAFSWPTSSFSGLVELDLNDLVGFASPLLNDLVTLLTNCRALSTLRLQGVNIRSNQQEAHRAISLPQLRLLELGLLENNEGMRQLVELLSPGSHALDFRLHLASLNYNGLAPHIRSLLTRSNTTYLTLKDFHSNSDDHFRSILSAAPHLRALLLHDVSLSIGLNIFDGMLTPIKGLAKRFPQLQCLCLIFGDISPAVIGQLERIATLSNIRSLVFWSCRFWKPPSSEPNDSDEEDSNGERWSPHLPQSARQLLSGRFEKVIVQDAPLSRTFDSLDNICCMIPLYPYSHQPSHALCNVVLHIHRPVRLRNVSVVGSWDRKCDSP